MRGDPAVRELFRLGQRIEREGFILLWVRRSGRRATGFMAGRRLGGSVVRNRGRRRLREAFRREQARLPGEGLRLCFVARRGCLTQGFSVLRAGMAAALDGVAAQVGL